VCSEPAPDHLHFGARCCYSCRAFFRRRAIRREELRCRTSLGDCQLDINDKKCIACRYQKCLRIGMDPLLVQGSRKRQRKREDIDVGETTTTEIVETSEHLDTVDSDHHVLSPVEHKPFSPSFTLTNHSQTSTSSSSFQPLTFPRRESVIKRVGREDRTKLNPQADEEREGPSKLTMQAEILKSYGNILTHTGNLFHYHADLISKDDTSEDTRPERIKQEIKQEEGDASRVKEELTECPVDTAEFSSALADKIFEEAQELIQNSPWIFEPETLSCVLPPAETVEEIFKGPSATHQPGTLMRSSSEDQRLSQYTSVIQRKRSDKDH